MSQERWTDEHLQAMRAEADPTADAVVARIYETDAVSGVNRLLANLSRPDRPLDPAIQALVDQYMAETAQESRVRQCIANLKTKKGVSEVEFA